MTPTMTRLARPRRGSVVCTLFVLLSGCTTPLFRGQSPEPEEQVEVFDDEAQLVRDLASPVGTNYVRVESVGLVTRLNGTGSDPAPSPHVDALVAEMQTHNVRGVRELLASSATSLVLVSGVIPPGAQERDTFDLQVHVPARSETTSLRGGWLMRNRMREYQMLNNQLHNGHVIALAEGPLLIDAHLDKAAGKNSEVRGRILGGGVALQARPLGLVIREEHSSVRTSTLIAGAVNNRFHATVRGTKTGAANPKDDAFIELSLHPRYRHNVFRYMEVVKSMAVGETAAEQHERLQLLERKLLEPTSAASAALQLEGLGKIAIPTLHKGIASQDAEVRFYAAEALAYLDDVQSVRPLVEAARQERAFRWRALTALAGLPDVEAYDGLTGLFDVPSAETRYGAFRALWLRNGKDLGGEILAEEFALHQIPSKAEPLIHLSRTRRPEIVLFGQSQLQAPQVLYAGPQILLKGLPDGQIRLSRFAPGEDDQQLTCSPALPDVIRSITKLKGSYAEVMECLLSARERGYLAARIEIDALPRPDRRFQRDRAEEESFVAQPEIQVTDPVPDVFADQLGDSERLSAEADNFDIEPQERRSRWGFLGKMWPLMSK